jgi:nucleotide-binding universal stress UspA family protein
MSKMLVPIDGSENSMRALLHAIQWVRAQQTASIHVVHAHEEPDIYGEIAVYVSSEKMAALQRQMSEARLAEAEEVLKSAGVPYTKAVLVGHIAEEIAKCASELGCNGIVMGTRGMTAFEGLVMGSVAVKVVHAATVPVTLVK